MEQQNKWKTSAFGWHRMGRCERKRERANRDASANRARSAYLSCAPVQSNRITFRRNTFFPPLYYCCSCVAMRTNKWLWRHRIKYAKACTTYGQPKKGLSMRSECGPASQRDLRRSRISGDFLFAVPKTCGILSKASAYV